MKATRALGWAGTAFVAAVIGGLLWNAPWLVGVGAATPEDLQAVSNRLTAKLPVMIDAETRLERVEAGAGLEQVLRFTLVNKDAADLDAAATTARLRERARLGVCGDASLHPLVQRGVRVTYVYRDRSGRDAIRFSVDPLECLWAKLRRAVRA